MDKYDELRELLPNALRRDQVRLAARLERMLPLPRQGEAFRAQAERLLAEARRSVELRHRRHERLPQISYPPALPITARKDEIVAAIRQNQVVVIAGETGSGKTTQIPKMCLEAGLGVEGKIGCTQPRRVAALSISRRIAEELRLAWGKEVGCKIRFADQSSPETYIKLMTDGILLAETQADPDLNEYEAIVIDEAHERSLNIDFLLGHLKLLLPRRPDLKVVITSATIDTESFSKAFNDAPIIEVSGRLFPVEIRYAPFDAYSEESGDITYIDAAVSAVENALLESHQGDILIFMPGERDIRETQDDLVGRFSGMAEVIPLFGRLSSGEQERVFSSSSRRKIIIATNIAETSLTIPGIRYVIDAGLARLSRYSPRTRTRRLPIEPISQSSANQRAGRSGRVEDGVCIRLYSEEDFAARPKYTQPEIQRSNLAEVILRMKAWRLGEIETFPFINPPSPQAISAGYQLLQELGALDDDRHLTPLGKDLARLPVDPSIGRMVLQSAREAVIEPVLIIAAGLSIQDPRERPMDRAEAADQAHRQFRDPDSDFLSLLNLWNAYHDTLENFKTQNQARRFCKANFLSFIRMREWRDVHAQLRDSLEELVRLPREEKNRAASPGKSEAPAPGRRGEPGRAQANYAGVHRSILAGLLGHIAHREERNIYKASGNRQFTVFPGSSLFDRNEKKAGPRKALADLENAPKPKSGSQPEWVVAGEIVETARLYGRTLAKVTPEWMVEIGSHVCKRTWLNPHWSSKAGRVLVQERVTLFGLEVQAGNIDYSKVNPREATEIFIQSALVGEEADIPHRFVEHNRQLRQRIEMWRTRSRNHRLRDTLQSLFDFYAQRLSGISSLHDLNRVIREQGKGDPNFLCATESDLAGGQELNWDSAAFPAQLEIDEQTLHVDYAYAPGEAHDGVTVKIPLTLAHAIRPEALDLAVPGLREEQIEFLLKALPKSLRVPLMPIAPKVKELAAEAEIAEGMGGLRKLVRQRYGIEIPAEAWKPDTLPEHLRPRVAITTGQKKTIAAGRDLRAIREGIEKHETPGEQKAWAAAAQRWEKFHLASWSFEDLPERIEVASPSGVSQFAWPGLALESGAVHLRLFRSRDEAERASGQGFSALAALALQKDLAWEQKDLRALDKVKDLYVTLGPAEDLASSALENLKRHWITPPAKLLPLLRSHFEAAVAGAKTRMAQDTPKLIDWVTAILRLRQEILLARKPYPGMKADVDALLPSRFPARIPFEKLQHVPRYLRAMQIRAERAALNPLKDAERLRLVQPYVEAWKTLAAKPPADQERAIDELRWMIEEFKVSTFAQELGTPAPISAKRLDEKLALIRSGGAAK